LVELVAVDFLPENPVVRVPSIVVIDLVARLETVIFFKGPVIAVII